MSGLLVAVWAAGAAVAVGTGLLAIDLVGTRVGEPVVPPPIGDSRPPSVSSSVSPRPGSRTATFGGRGGTIGVRCDGAVPRLLYATPAQGYRIDDRRDDGRRVEVRFRGEDDDTRLRVACVAGAPALD